MLFGILSRAFAGFILLAGTLVLAGPLTDRGTQPGLSYPLLNSSNCGACHSLYDPVNQIEPYDTWAGSMMAQASRDPLFWAALDVANNDIPGVGEFCLRCHLPVGWLEGRGSPPGGSADGCAMQDKIDERDQDFDGINCHLCHRMEINATPPPGEDPVYFENGQFWLDDSSCDGWGEPCRSGPYDYPVPPTAPHAWNYSLYHVDADFCGNCHNVTHPTKTLIDGGVDTGIPFPIERTFREWQQSDFTRGGPDFLTCQNCHMPDLRLNPVYASDQHLHNRAGNLPIHEFAGGNAWIPEVLAGEYPNLGLSSSFEATRVAALDMLQNRSATVEIVVPTGVGEGGTLEARVKVTNLTGHKLPTGYPEGRRMWLHVEARDALNNLLFASGAYDPVTALLNEDPQAKVYRAEPGIWDRNGNESCDIENGVGNPIFHFALNDCIAKDNRIPPKGFLGGTDPETRPVNYVYPETNPGSGRLVHWDLTDYAIPIPPGTAGPVNVTATLHYQTTSREYVEFLLEESETYGFPDDCIERSTGLPNRTRAEILHEMWNDYGKAPPVPMGSASALAAILDPTPGESSGPANPMRVTGRDVVTGEVSLSYDPACASSDHVVYHGDLAGVATTTLSGQACGLGSSGSATFDPGSGNVFWVVVANDGTVEGSYGVDSGGAERPENTTLPECSFPQELLARCD